MLQHALHERRIWRHFGGQSSHELSDAAAKRIPETELTARTPPFRTPWESRFNPNGNRSSKPASTNALGQPQPMPTWPSRNDSDEPWVNELVYQAAARARLAPAIPSVSARRPGM